jgi:hypothetical protein
MYFTSGRIKKCEMCVDQNKADTSNLIQRRYEIEEIRKKEEDKGWYPEPFRSEFRQHLAAFNPIQQLLFETIMDKRPRRNDFLMQAVDIVVRTTEKDMDIEFGTYGKARIERARRRLPKEIRMQTTKFIPVEEIPSLAYTTPRSMQEANPFLQMSGSVGSRNGDRTSSRHTKNFSR